MVGSVAVDKGLSQPSAIAATTELNDVPEKGRDRLTVGLAESVSGTPSERLGLSPDVTRRTVTNHAGSWTFVFDTLTTVERRRRVGEPTSQTAWGWVATSTSSRSEIELSLRSCIDERFGQTARFGFADRLMSMLTPGLVCPKPGFGVLYAGKSPESVDRQPPEKARAGRVATEQELGGGWGASVASVLEGGSEGKGARSASDDAQRVRGGAPHRAERWSRWA